MSNYLLFTNFIEYPTNGISKDAEESVNNNINKIIKITSNRDKINKISNKYLLQTSSSKD
jgi:hypothetical protein